MVGRARLHEHTPAAGSPPRPASHLRHKLERPLAGAEIGEMEAGVRVHDADDGDIGKVEPLAIICVPSRMSTSPRATRSRM